MVFPVIHDHHIWWFKVTKFQLSNSVLLPVFIICGFLLKKKKKKTSPYQLFGNSEKQLLWEKQDKYLIFSFNQFSE